MDIYQIAGSLWRLDSGRHYHQGGPGINAESYGPGISAAQIPEGEVAWSSTARLPEVLKIAEGKSADAKTLGAVSNDPTPGKLKE